MSAHREGQPSELDSRREALAAEVAELHWNLGGLAYEMAIRDHFRVDVLVRRAAMLQEREAELAEVERLLHMREGSIAGACASCGAVRSRGAVFCWQCGAQVMERSPARPVGMDVGFGAGSDRNTARPVVAPAVSRETDAASRSLARADDLGVGRPVPIP